MRSSLILPCSMGVSALHIVFYATSRLIGGQGCTVVDSHESQRSRSLGDARFGGIRGFLLRLLRVIVVLALFTLSVASLGEGHALHLVFLIYATCLAMLSLVSAKNWTTVADIHLGFLLFCYFAYCIAQDLYPFTFVNGKPPAMSAIFRLILSFVSGVVVPLLIPPEPSSDPAKGASMWSFLTWSYLDHVIFYATRHGVVPLNEMPPLQHKDDAVYLQAQFKHIDPTLIDKKRHIFWSLVTIFQWDYVLLAVLIVIQSGASFLAPVGIQQLLQYLEHKDGTAGAKFKPWVWILWLALGPLVSAFLDEWYKFVGTAVRVRAEALITQLVFAHALRIRLSSDAAASTVATGGGGPSSEADDESVDTAVDGVPSSEVNSEDGEAAVESMVGKINNLITNDVSAIITAADYPQNIVRTVLQIIGSAIYLYLLVGWAAFVGTAVFLITIPIPARAGRFQLYSQSRKMQASDMRVQAVTQMMGVLRMLKLFAWEKKASEKLTDLREEELFWTRRNKLLNLINYAIGNIMPLLTVVATYGTFVLVMKGNLTSSVVFTSVSVFGILESQVFRLMELVPELIAAKVSLDRLGDWLYNSVLLQPPQQASMATEDGTIGFKACEFSWNARSNKKRNFRLIVEERVTFERGRVNLIVGPTGAGKTSVLAALLGEMYYHPHTESSYTSLPREGGIAYAAQEGWVLNSTIRANILFGTPHDASRYKMVLDQCGLVHDLSLFAAGDMTEVGEKGLTLSGGQRARVTLARAVYSKAEILLLDDVLAALDVHTAQWVVDKCLRGDILHGRTVLLVTHNLALTRTLAAKVVRIDNAGRVTEEASLENAIQHDALLRKDLARETELMEKDELVYEKPQVEMDDQVRGKLMVAEDIAYGSVSWASMMLYLGNMGGITFWTLRTITIFGKSGLYLGRAFYLGYWSTQYENHSPSEVPAKLYLAGYALIVFTSVLFGVTGDALWIGGSQRASRIISQLLVDSILGSTFRWLDTVPTARAITRCTQDLGSVDGRIPAIWGTLIRRGANLVLMFIGISYIVGWPALVTGLFVSVAGLSIGRMYIAAQRSIKREQSVAKSPVMSVVGATLAALPSVRAYGAENMFKEQLAGSLNHYTRLLHNFYDVNRWIDIRMEALGSIFAVVVASGIVYGGVLNGAYAGFALSHVLFFSEESFWFVRTLNRAEVEFTSLERINDFLGIEHEPKPTLHGTPPAYWPSSGSLKAVGLCAGYGPDSPDILHDISFDIKAGERIGIVGRTGAGKSTISLALLRGLLTRGKVLYDGLDIHDMNLDALRANVTLIPQHPELLVGTLRENLDPFGEHEEAELVDALRSSGLYRLQREGQKSTITLDSQVEGGGANFSHGQRQIIALARAKVRRSKLMIMDEATAAIDYETDNVIQDSIRSTIGSDVTIITIAHRLQTIMDSDRVMVLDAGRLVEFAEPKELLSQKKGLFYELVEGSHDRDKLYAKMR